MLAKAQLTSCEVVIMYEVRFHGRGGQGAVTASEILAVAAAKEGKFSSAFPFFGVERRGAPVTSFCRIDSQPIRLHQQVYTPNCVVVLDGSLVHAVDVAAGLVAGGDLIINTSLPKENFNYPQAKVHVLDITAIALEKIGKPFVNTASLGAVAKATGQVKPESLLEAVGARFPGPAGEKNKAALQACYEQLK